jgi:hypothetical protein
MLHSGVVQSPETRLWRLTLPDSASDESPKRRLKAGNPISAFGFPVISRYSNIKQFSVACKLRVEAEHGGVESSPLD